MKIEVADKADKKQANVRTIGQQKNVHSPEPNEPWQQNMGKNIGILKFLIAPYVDTC